MIGLLVWVGGYLGLGFVVLVVVLKLRPDWAWKEKVEWNKTGTKTFSAAALEEQLGKLAGGFEKWLDLAYPDTYSRMLTGSGESGRREWGRHVRAELATLATKEWEIREKKHLGWESPDALPWAETGIVLGWPLTIPLLLGSIVIRSTQRSVNNQTRTRAELEKELAAARKEVDELMQRGEL